MGLVFGCYSKSTRPPVTVAYVVDDYPNFAEHYGGYAISAFEGTPEDRELLKVVEALRHIGGSGSGP